MSQIWMVGKEENVKEYVPVFKGHHVVQFYGVGAAYEAKEAVMQGASYDIAVIFETQSKEEYECS